MDEGYIKFQVNWTPGPALPPAALHDLQLWRSVLYQRKLIGVYDNGVGYGNISRRYDAAGQFIISGSATGYVPMLSEAHFTLVTQVDIAHNTVWCEGPIVASSETMSHAVIYQTCPEINGVMHVHHIKLWKKLLHKVPTTNASATYGSPEMAYSIIELLQKTDLRQQRIFVMEGHPEGIFTFGESLAKASEVLLRFL